METANTGAGGIPLDRRRWTRHGKRYGTRFFASQPSNKSASRNTAAKPVGQGGLPQWMQELLSRMLTPTSIIWAWGIHGLVGVILGFALLSQLGATMTTVRALVGLWVLLTAGAAAWRWQLDSRRGNALLSVAIIGLVVGLLVVLGGGFSLTLVKWALGLFWLAAGALELIAWFQHPAPTIEWPWIAGFAAFVGLVTITWPTPLTTDFTVVAGIWAIVLSIVHLVRWIWLMAHGGELAPPLRGRSLLVRTLLIALPAVLVAAPVLVYGTVLANSTSENSRQAALNTFYQPPSNLAPGAPGSIVRIESLSTPGVHGRGWRILFRSQDVHGDMTISSGVVYAPSTNATDRFVVAWAHGTVGTGPQCAPSRQSSDTALLPWVNDMLDRGWVVTAPDYAGAGGTGGPGATEVYVVGPEQGRDLLNGVRAARNIPQAEAGTRFAIYGHSQGGAVALWGASLAPTYTPELALVAVGAVSAASDWGDTLHEQWNRPLTAWVFGPMLTYPWTRYYPNLSASAILTSAGVNHYQEMAVNNCISDIGPILLNQTMGSFFAKDPTTEPNWRKVFIANQAPLVSKGIPVFIGHGLADTLITPTLSAWLVTRYCANGTAVVTDWLPNEGHPEAAIHAAPQYAQWLANIVSGQTPVSDCGKPLPITPAHPLT